LGVCVGGGCVRRRVVKFIFLFNGEVVFLSLCRADD